MSLPDTTPGDNRDHDEAKRLRDEGCDRAASRKPAATLDLQIRFVRHLIQKGPATLDEVDTPDERRKKFQEKKGNWRGAAVAGLVRSGIIESIGDQRRSLRPSRHAGSNRVWQIRNHVRAVAFVAKNRSSTP